MAPEPVELILGNSNSKFSGVTSTMLENLRYQRDLIGLRVLGEHHLGDPELAIGFSDLARLCRQPLPNGLPRVFHARRNDEMIQALLLKHLFRAKIKILFTSTAQRYHSGLTRWLMAKMDAVISTCSYAAHYLPFKPAAIVPHGVDTEKFQPVASREALLNELGYSDQKLLGCFGRVRKQKGVHLFVRACIEQLPKSPEHTAIICGAWDDQELVAQLQQEVEQAGLSKRIQFLGEQPQARVAQLFQACEIVAALSANEGFGLTVLEAMGCGAAVLATKAGAWPDIIREGVDGFLIETESPAQTSQKLGELLLHTEQTQKMGASGRQRVVEQFDIRTEASTLVSLYRQLQEGNLSHK